jgi:hypothetical protein
MSSQQAPRKSSLPVTLTILAVVMTLPLGAVAFFGESWLVSAVEQGDATTVEWLLRFNPKWACSEKSRDWKGNPRSLLSVAIARDHVEITLLLINNGAKENETPEEYLRIREGLVKSPKTLKKFIEMGIFWKKYSLLHWTLCRFTFNKEYKECVKLLLENGADVNAFGEVYAGHLHRPLYIAYNREAIKLLLQHGADPNLKDCGGCNSLFYVHPASPECAQPLLDAGADPNLPANNGETPIFYTVRIRSHKATKALLNADADPNHRNNEGCSVLFYSQYYDDIMELLFDAGADPNLSNNEGETPLFYALKNLEQEKAIALLKAGANPLWKNNAGKTPLDYWPDWNQSRIFCSQRRTASLDHIRLPRLFVCGPTAPAGTSFLQKLRLLNFPEVIDWINPFSHLNAALNGRPQESAGALNGV